VSSIADDAAAPSPAPAASPVFSQGRIRAALWLLMLCYMFNFIDRQIVNILAEPIGKELGLSDTQIGMMTGLSFAFFYTVLGIPLARFADRPQTNRVALISCCLALWSSMTALGAGAQNFTHMLLARIGVGAGEAGCTPAATSLITDLVPPQRRARAMAFYGIGLPIGSLLGLAIGGTVSDALGWRAALLIVGLPGLILAAIVFTVIREPRKELAALKLQQAPAPPLGEVLREITGSRAFMWMLIGSSASAFLAYGKGVWQIVYLIRTHDLSPGAVGVGLGIASGLLGMCGTWLGGYLGDRFGSKNPRHYMTAPILGALAAVPMLAIAYTTDNTPLAIALIAVPALLNGLGFGPTFATIQGLVRPQSRAMAVSIKLFVQTLVGLGLGPLVFGMISDAIKPIAGEDSVRWVLLFAVSLLFVGAFGDWRASLNMKRELRYHE
jgi:MFS family permease